MMNETAGSRINELTATGIVAAIAAGRTTCEAVARACLERIAAREPQVRAWTHLDPDRVIDQARALDRAPPQPLADLVDLAQGHRAVRRHALGDKGRVRPHEVAGEMIDPGGVVGGHAVSSQ